MRTSVEIEYQNGYNYFIIDTDDYDKIQSAAVEILGCDTWYDPQSDERLNSALARFFDKHKDFYDAIDFESGRKHGGGGESFSTTGFRKFVQEYFDSDVSRIDYVDPEKDGDKLQIVCDALAERLAEVVEQHEGDGEDNDYIVKSQIRMDTDGGESLNDPELVDEAILVNGDSAHKIEVKEVEDVATLNDVEEKVRDQTKGVYETQVNTRVQTLKNRISDLEEELQEEKQNMLVKGLKMLDDMDNWTLEDGRLKYQKTVHAKKATRTRGEGENPKKLTEEAKEKFYIEGLQIPITATVTKAYYDEGYHPHALDYGTCAGSFRYPLEEALDKIIEQMEQINLHAHENNDAEREMKENFDEYTKDEEEEVWEA